MQPAARCVELEGLEEIAQCFPLSMCHERGDLFGQQQEVDVGPIGGVVDTGAIARPARLERRHHTGEAADDRLSRAGTG